VPLAERLDLELHVRNKCRQKTDFRQNVAYQD